MAQRTAIALDGTDRPVQDGSIAFAVGSVAAARPRRPLVGLAIAFVTAILTMGALGPHRAPPVLAPAPDTDATEAADIDAAMGTRAALEATPAPIPSRTPWWQLPQMALWVDPANGRSMQAAADRHERPRLADHRARDN